MINTHTLEVFEIVHYQWTFCSVCTSLPFMNWCDKSKDKMSMHYRYYTLRNIRTGKEHEVAGHLLDEAQRKGKMKETWNQKGQWQYSRY